ncbi:ATP-dependent DNA helicase [Desulfitibacter alkalitolerans]|uniref:ATP-dependent DNA helicase n=1 Tax=Desulfitibacter alkalitolerans TaxID=264641 RepID=UPI000486C901|nr:helicase C-terminal domain-containing protein [Desulfitibacter alkalitolerans]
MGTISSFFKEELLKHRPDFEVREGQLAMGLEVEKYLNSHENYFIEAGTGVGKSLAYLIPAAHWAIESRQRVVVSTFSKALQNQLLEKDLPLVEEIFKARGPLKVVMAKGRSNYICLRRYNNALSIVQDANILKQIKLWDDNDKEKKQQLGEIVEYVNKGIGERDYIECPTNLIWDDICSQRYNCLKYRCPWKKQCFINSAREEQVAAHILIVNHALFFADLALKPSGNSLLPDYTKVIFDEAHHIEDVIAESFAMEMSSFRIRNFSQMIVNSHSSFGKAVRLNEGFYEDVKELRRVLEEENTTFFNELENHLLNSSTFSYQSELVKETGLREKLNSLIKYINAPEVGDILELSYEAEGERENIAAAGHELLADLDFLLAAEANDFVYWIEKDDAGSARLKACPIEPANILELDLFSDARVLFTSATLATGGSFAYMAERLGVKSYCHKICESPFEYNKQCLVLIPRKGLHPKSPDYNEYIIECCKKILSQTRGRAFILFTSYSSLNYCYDKMHGWLGEEGLSPMAQGRGISPFRLLEQFKQADSPVLFGTSSFWEGMDVPGDKLTCVIVTRLPFAVPSHPLEAARMNKLKDMGKNDFLEYSVPKAVIKFKQGFGRLIRSKNDKGVVVVLDTRIKLNTYGKYFLNSLPDVSISNYLSEISRFLLNDTN